MNANILRAFLSTSSGPNGRSLDQLNAETELAAHLYRGRVAQRTVNAYVPEGSRTATDAVVSTFH